MIVFLNGQFVPEEKATVSVFDRSFQYGDGLFETLRIVNGKPFRGPQHLERLGRGAEFIGIALPPNPQRLTEALMELVRLNKVHDGVVRIALSRGVGQRGYSPKGADQPTTVISCHPAEPLPTAPQQWTLLTSSFRLNATDPLNRCKSSNKLLQVLARREVEQRGADEALLLNDQGEVAEAASGNVFWFEKDRLITPPVSAGLLPGITRAVVMELAPALSVTVVEKPASADELMRATGVFVTLSSPGIVEAAMLDGHSLPSDARTSDLYCRYRQLVVRECA